MSDTTAPATRTIDGVELPAVGTWKVDPGHAEFGFMGRHLKFTKVRGRFTDVGAWPTATFRSTDITWNQRAGTITGELTIKDVTRPVTLDAEFLGAVTDP